MQTVPPVWPTWLTASWIVSGPLACDLCGHAGGAAAVMSFAGGRPGIATVADGTGADVPDAEPGIMVMNAARRRPLSSSTRRPRCALQTPNNRRYLKPLAPVDVEADRHAVLRAAASYAAAGTAITPFEPAASRSCTWTGVPLESVRKIFPF